MSSAHLFLVGLITVGLAAFWYDRRVEETRTPSPARPAAAEVAVWQFDK